MSWIEPLLAQYGYAALFFLLAAGIVGPLIPDETILVLAGILIHRGTLSPIPTVLCACAGSLCGITLSYELGRRGLIYLLRKWAGSHMDQAHSWFERYGRWTLFFGYFLAGVRHFTALIAGSTAMAFPVFAAYAYTGAVVWVITFLGIGYFVGDRWAQVEPFIHKGAMIGAGAAVFAALIWWKFFKKKAG